MASQQASLPIAFLAQRGTSSACLSIRPSPPTPWVIDSAATDHMSGISSLFTHIQSSSSLSPVTVADGSTVPIRGIGTVEPSPSLSLSSVLYIPSFSFNLMSVSKLTKHLHCCLIASLSSVVLQDLRTRKTIGTGREENGLY